jgi:hypothetical protein
MRAKIIIIAVAAILAIGVGMHLSGHCPLKGAKACSSGK